MKFVEGKITADEILLDEAAAKAERQELVEQLLK